MTLECTVVGVSVEDNDSYTRVALEFDSHPGYLLIERSKDPSTTDRRLGMDRTYIEIGDQLHGSYGAVTDVRAKDQRLEIAFKPEQLQTTFSELGLLSGDGTKPQFSAAVEAIIKLIELDGIDASRA